MSVSPGFNFCNMQYSNYNFTSVGCEKSAFSQFVSTKHCMFSPEIVNKERKALTGPLGKTV